MSEVKEERCQHFEIFTETSGSGPHNCLPYQSSSSTKKVEFENSDEEHTLENPFKDPCSCSRKTVFFPSDVPEPPEIEKKFSESDISDNQIEHQKIVESENAFSYLPQSGDEEPSKDHLKSMGPIGPWATGQVDWSPLSGITGVRPIVDRYSITRYSQGEWRQHNKELLQKTYEAFDNEHINDNNCKSILAKVYDLVDKSQMESNRRLKDRAKLVENWKTTLERAIKALIDEISALESERIRLKKSLAILQLPQAIVSECLEKRSTRSETELVRDGPEEELMKEISLIEEIRLILNKTISDVEQQQAENRAARQKLEFVWSDKRDAYRIDVLNIDLDNESKTTLFKPGSAKFPTDQSSEESWLQFTKETVKESEKCRQKSVKLRKTLNEILMNAARDLRTQADTVEMALRARIACTQDILIRLENELKQCLQKLADTENRIEKLKMKTQNLDNAMKVAQTRLDNRHNRENVENCRDYALKGLIEEVKIIQEAVGAMLASLNDTENVKERLVEIRMNLEKDIMFKRRTVMIDKERCLLLRSHFPSAAALSGFTSI